jgi:hypothetical protein
LTVAKRSFSQFQELDVEKIGDVTDRHNEPARTEAGEYGTRVLWNGGDD